MMKKICFSFLFLFTVVSTVTAQQAVVQNVFGDVEVQKAGQSTWTPVSLNAALSEGDKISTGYQSSVQLAFEDNSVVTVKPLTQFTIHRFKQDGSKVTTNLNVKIGEIRAKVAKGPDFVTDFSVTTPTGVVSVRGTEKSVDVGDQGTDVETHEGQVQNENQQGDVTGVDQGQTSNTPGPNEDPSSGIESRHEQSLSDMTTNVGLTDEEKEFIQDNTDVISDPGTIEGGGVPDFFDEILNDFESSEDNYDPQNR